MHGKLTKWNDSRGFGFISTEVKEQDIFVHISAFTGNSPRPRIGEPLSFEVETDEKGKQKAINVRRALDYSSSSSSSLQASKGAFFTISNVMIFSTLILLGVILYSNFSHYFNSNYPSADVTPSISPSDLKKEQFVCDGRQYCSQMRSRREAEFFISNCPNSKMDGDNDGIPCENDSRF